jgi:NADH:ubiquinone oxidoreductase subunit 6 (subunit J)
MAMSPPPDNRDIERFEEFLETLGTFTKELSTSVVTWVSRHPLLCLALKGLEPAIPGFVLSIIYLSTALWSGHGFVSTTNYPVALDKEAMTSNVISIGFLSLGVAFVAGNSPLALMARKFIAAPILRLVQHALAVSVGAILGLAVFAKIFSSMNWNLFGAAILLALVGAVLTVFVHLAAVFADGTLFERFSQKQAFRALAFFFGLILILTAIHDIRNSEARKSSAQAANNHESAPNRK